MNNVNHMFENVYVHKELSFNVKVIESDDFDFVLIDDNEDIFSVSKEQFDRLFEKVKD